jgi:hypothetical protein
VLRRERAERSVLGVDLEREAAIPEDDEVPGFVDLVDDASVASAEPGFDVGIADELDPRAHTDASPDAGQKVSCALWIHGLSIGSRARRSIPHSFRFLKPFGQGGVNSGPAKSRGPADRPNSTA